jgi:hypothetical protein
VCHQHSHGSSHYPFGKEIKNAKVCPLKNKKTLASSFLVNPAGLNILLGAG